MQANADHIQELCRRIIAEKDVQKMVLLAKRLDAVIVEREQKLRKSQQHEAPWEMGRTEGKTEGRTRGWE
jgi:HJR/Mrr/RecB family endonuclease